jgi:hypothetical protein
MREIKRLLRLESGHPWVSAFGHAGTPLMRTLILGLVLALTPLFGVGATPVPVDAYVCVANLALGLTFSKRSKEWGTTTLSVKDQKFLLKRKNGHWVWSKFGEEYQLKCGAFNEHGVISCDILLSQLELNRKTLRFKIYHPPGYMTSDDPAKSADTPHLTIGTCSPL